MTVTINISGLGPISEAINSLARALGASGLTAAVKDPVPAPQDAPVQPVQPVPVQPVPAQPVPVQPVPVQPVPVQPVPAQPVPVQPVPAQPVPVQPVPAQPVPVQPAQVQPAPVQPAPVQPVPTSAVPYTLDDLARAAMALMDSGRQGDLIQMLASFGVEALPALPPAQYGAFATALRGMGAQI